METNVSRNYKGKDEELPVMAGYVAFSFERDLAEFQAYSPIFSAEIRKLQNAHTTSKWIDFPGYRDHPPFVQWRSGSIPPWIRCSILWHAFRVTSLWQGKASLRLLPSLVWWHCATKIVNRDSEGVLKSLRVINDNIALYLPNLQEVGLSDEMVALLKNAQQSISEDNLEQYKIVMPARNWYKPISACSTNFYASIMELCSVGKILYKSSNPQKLQEYTYTELIKRVRLVTSSSNDEVADSKEKVWSNDKP